MQSFSFWINAQQNPDPLQFTANLVQWNGLMPIGPRLYTSAPLAITAAAGVTEKYQFNLPNIAVTGGDQYMAFLTTLDVSDGLTGTAYVGFIGSDVLPGGRAFVSYATTDSELLQQDWAYLQPSVDLVFQAQFTGVPEPGVTSLAICIVTTLIVFRRNNLVGQK